jgi:hypothetical protein
MSDEPEASPRVAGVHVAFGTPRKLPKPARLPGRVAVVDIAFAAEGGGRRNAFDHTTLPFIEGLGERLAAWVDHHDSQHHARFAGDPRFTLATKAEHGACPEMITPEIVRAAGPVESVVCHTDFDGLASAAKWILGGEEPYPGCDRDAYAVDTRVGFPGEPAARIDRALRARSRDENLMLAAVRLLVARLDDDAAWAAIDEAGAELLPREAEARNLAARYEALSDEVVLVDATLRDGPYDRTLLLLLGQERAKIAVVLDGENATFAAPFGSGVDFLSLFGLSGGMPTVVSLHRPRLPEALRALGLPAEVVARFDARPAQPTTTS